MRQPDTVPASGTAPPHRRSRLRGNPGQGPGAGPSPSLELPAPAIVVPAKAGIQRCAGRPHAPTNPHPPPSYRRKPVSRGAPSGGTPPPTHIAGALRDSVRPEPVEGPSTTNSARAPPRPLARVVSSPFRGNPGQGRGAGPSPTLIPTPNTLTRPHCPHAVPSPTLLPCTTHASTPAPSPRHRECRGNLRKTRRKTPKTHSFRTKRVVSAEASFVGDSFPTSQKAH